MKLRYRMKYWYHDNDIELRYYTAEYRILWIWLYININMKGCISQTGTVQCETSDEALDRLNMHKLGMKRASVWMERKNTIILESDER